MFLKKKQLKEYIFANSGTMDITDPAYDKGTCCRMKVDVKPTTYRCVYYIGSHFNNDEISEYMNQYENADEKSYIKENFKTIDEYLQSRLDDIQHRCFEMEIQEKGRAFPRDSKKWKPIGTIGVDSGMAGFFPDKPDFNDKEWNDFCDNIALLKGPAYFKSDLGFWTNSGYGDGGYKVEAIKENNQIIALRILF